ncbi:YhcH/YjgK/YiaL family protein [Volucribacter amazonae]|uniref:YhcH/YjgK/YiaL family protein n=1 Tax=Volucribacter amazonae TaxID=256731 RepID=A0A9X4PGZ5_9PAST|nr:YhcH/YjgK/YiaL family protein [Volucribacter amazonae]MDG6895015.1 hypothetical protein [Volucribacter amazonae]
MFFGHIQHIDFHLYPSAVQKALRFLQQTDFDQLEVGRYELEGDKIYVQVLDLQTQSAEQNLPEVHRHYLDVQYLHSGIEKIGVVADNGNNPVAQPYDTKRDILFYANVENESYLIMRPGNFAVFFPNDIHRPNCIDGQSSPIRKVVVKIAMSQLSP